MKRGKRYVEAAKLVDRASLYEAADAISIVKKAAGAKFDETVELHIRTGCDGRHADQQIRGAVVLPHGTGKTVRILVFAKGPKAEEAQAAGADFVGAEELIPKIPVSYTHLRQGSRRVQRGSWAHPRDQYLCGAGNRGV